MTDLRESMESPRDEIARINDLSEELNREAEDVLEYQVIPPRTRRAKARRAT
jgi:hypothetical protein